MSFADAPCKGLPTTAVHIGKRWFLLNWHWCGCELNKFWFEDQIEWMEVLVGDIGCSIIGTILTGEMFSVLETLLVSDDLFWIGGAGWINKHRLPYGQIPLVVYFSHNFVLYFKWLRIWVFAGRSSCSPWANLQFSPNVHFIDSSQAWHITVLYVSGFDGLRWKPWIWFPIAFWTRVLNCQLIKLRISWNLRL